MNYVFAPWETLRWWAIIKVTSLTLSTILMCDSMNIIFPHALSLENIERMNDLYESGDLIISYMDPEEFPEDIRATARLVKINMINRYMGTGLFTLEDFSHPGSVLVQYPFNMDGTRTIALIPNRGQLDY